jgi:hypothetical protein
MYKKPQKHEVFVVFVDSDESKVKLYYPVYLALPRPSIG